MDKADEQHLEEYKKEEKALNYRLTTVKSMIARLEAMKKAEVHDDLTGFRGQEG